MFLSDVSSCQNKFIFYQNKTKLQYIQPTSSTPVFIALDSNILQIH